MYIKEIRKLEQNSYKCQVKPHNYLISSQLSLIFFGFDCITSKRYMRFLLLNI